MKNHVIGTLALTLATVGGLAIAAVASPTSRHQTTTAHTAETWRAVVEIGNDSDIIDHNLSLGDCMDLLGKVEKSRPVIEVTYCEREG